MVGGGGGRPAGGSRRCARLAAFWLAAAAGGGAPGFRRQTSSKRAPFLVCSDSSKHRLDRSPERSQNRCRKRERGSELRARVARRNGHAERLEIEAHVTRDEFRSDPLK